MSVRDIIRPILMYLREAPQSNLGNVSVSQKFMAMYCHLFTPLLIKR